MNLATIATNNLATIAIVLLILVSFFVMVHSTFAKVKVATVKCIDLISGDTVLCRVKYTGILTPFNKKAVLDYAKNQLEIGGVLANEICIID